jgi:hypothetical protein
MNNVTIYLELVAAYFAVASESNAAAIDAFEDSQPEVIDAAYASAGPMSYEIVSGVVTSI